LLVRFGVVALAVGDTGVVLVTVAVLGRS